ncbi:MAG: hypothetical protein ACK47B_04735 [Armatimonadota bacterium]
MFFLAHWPMYLYGVSIERLPALGVALLRMAVYSSLAWGIAQRAPAAWGATILELWRSLLALLVVMVVRSSAGGGDFYPAAWAQGLLSGALPSLFLVSAALWSGWRPGGELELAVAVAVRLLAGGAGVAAIWLRSAYCWFGAPAPTWRAVGACGAGGAAWLLAAELAAVWWSLRGGG